MRGRRGASRRRLEAIADYYENREARDQREPGSYRPLAPDALYLSRDEWQALIGERPLHLASPFHEPESDAGHRLRRRRRPAISPPSGRRAPISTRPSSTMSPSSRRSGQQGRARQLFARLARAAEGPARRSRAQGAASSPRTGRRRSGRRASVALARAPARSRLHQARRRPADRAGHARRPARPPPQEAQDRRRLPRRAGDALAPATSSSTPTTASAATRA